MFIDKIEKFARFSQFETLKDFNNNFEQWMLDIKDQFTKSQYIALRRLTKFCASVFGVCTAKIGTIVSATYNKGEMGGISRSTFKRMISVAKRLGLISVYETTRKNGSQSCNVYVFNRYQSNEPPKDGNLNHQENYQSSKTTKTSNKERKAYDYEHVSSNIPNEFINAISPYFKRADEVLSLWGKLTLATRKSGLEGLKWTRIDRFVKTFKEVIYSYKSNRIKGDLLGYLYSAWSNIAIEEVRRININNGIYYDWLVN